MARGNTAVPPGGGSESGNGGGTPSAWGWTPPWRKNQKGGAPAGSGPMDREATPEADKRATPKPVSGATPGR